MVCYSHILMQTEILTPQRLNFEQELLQEHREHHTVGFFFFFFCDVYIYCMGKLLTNCHTVVDIYPLRTEIPRVKEKL